VGLQVGIFSAIVLFKLKRSTLLSSAYCYNWKFWNCW